MRATRSAYSPRSGMRPLFGFAPPVASAPPPSGDLYDWNTAPTGPISSRTLYTSLDLDAVYYTSTGDWGTAEAHAKPDPPVTTGSPIVVTSSIEWDAAIASGVHIQIEGDLAAGVSTSGADDVIIQLMDGGAVNSIAIDECDRIYTCGETAGATGTGRVNGYILSGLAGACSSIVVDGIVQEGGGFYCESNATTAAAYLRSACKDGDIAYWFTDLVVAGSNFNSSLGWCVRFNNVWQRIVFVDCHLANGANATVRFHPTTSPLAQPGPGYVVDCTLGNYGDQFVWRVDKSTDPQEEAITAIVIETCILWAGTAGMEASPGESNVADYYRMIDCDIYTSSGTWSPAGTTGPDWDSTYTVGDSDSFPLPATSTRNTATDPATL